MPDVEKCCCNKAAEKDLSALGPVGPVSPVGRKTNPAQGFLSGFHILCLPDDFADIYSRLCLLLVSARLCGEANATLIHTCIREVWQLRDRISGLI